MSSFTYIRSWCPTCMRETTQRRHAPEAEASAKVECSEHTDGKRVDWVDVAVRAADGHR